MNKTIRDIIGDTSVSIHTILPEASLMDAVREMSSKRVGCLIVEKKNNYVGIITERDVTDCCAECLDVYEAKVRDAMTGKISFVRPDDTLEDATRIMRDKGIRHLPVFEGEKIIYVLSIRDLAFAKVDELQADMDILADQVFSWELDGEKHQFYKEVLSSRSRTS